MKTGTRTQTRHNTSLSSDTCLPFVSVVVPVFNGQRTIAACIEALLAQVYPVRRREIIIVDNNSNDGTPAIISKYPVKLAYERDLQSSYAARNTGVRQAQGEIIAFTDSDCIAEPDWLSRLVEPFEEETVVGVGGEVLAVQANNLVEQFIGRHLSLKHCHQNEGRLLPGLITANAAYLRQDLIDVGLFNTMFRGSDIDLSWRLQLQTDKRICFAPGAVVYHSHRSSIRSLFRWQSHLGLGQILMTCLYRDFDDPFYRPAAQLKSIVKQFIALLTYVCSFIKRLIVWVINSEDKDSLYLAEPVLSFVTDSGLLLGRMKGLWMTRLFAIDVSTQTWEEPGG